MILYSSGGEIVQILITVYHRGASVSPICVPNHMAAVKAPAANHTPPTLLSPVKETPVKATRTVSVEGLSHKRGI